MLSIRIPIAQKEREKERKRERKKERKKERNKERKKGKKKERKKERKNIKTFFFGTVNSKHLTLCFSFLHSDLRAYGIPDLFGGIDRRSDKGNALLRPPQQSSLQQLHVEVQVFGRHASKFGAVHHGNDGRTLLEVIQELAQAHGQRHCKMQETKTRTLDLTENLTSC